MPPSARHAAVLAIADIASRFPDAPPIEPDIALLSAADARLATAIHRSTLQRWLTYEHILNKHLKKPANKLDPAVRAILITGLAQMLTFDRLPTYAVIDEAVGLTKKLGQSRASGMVNAVLRKLADLPGEPIDTWQPAADALPMPGGKALQLTRSVLPSPDNLLAHLAVATSHPMPLMQRWFKHHGRESATQLALHSLENPPTFVVDGDDIQPWTEPADQLASHLAASPGRRVQDPASILAVAATADLAPKSILDLCAGRGTKTRQLRELHPDAQIVAHDPDPDRLIDLQEVPGITVGLPQAMQTFDLILLDVPCSNTGVLARRPAARYRMNPRNLASLVALQREIMRDALPCLAPAGHLLYSTCSLEPEENGEQAQWLLKHASDANLEIVSENQVLPAGHGPQYHDGSYHALIRRTA